MHFFDVVLFDLDGTLTDPRRGIFNSFHYALDKLGLAEKNPDTMHSLIGPPLRETFKKRYGVADKQIEQAVIHYREYFGDKGLFENEIYDGIPGLLKNLKNDGRKVILATTKADIYAERILEHFQIKEYFDFLSCATFDGSRTDKGEIIAHALKQQNIKGSQSVAMTGDRLFDIMGAKQNGIASIGVVYGFGTREELRSAGSDYLVTSVAELAALLL